MWVNIAQQNKKGRTATVYDIREPTIRVFCQFSSMFAFRGSKTIFCSEPQATQKCRRATRQRQFLLPARPVFSLLTMVRLVRLKLNFTECAAQIRRVVLSMSTTEWKFSLLLLLRLHSFPSRTLLSFFFSFFSRWFLIKATCWIAQCFYNAEWRTREAWARAVVGRTFVGWNVFLSLFSASTAAPQHLTIVTWTRSKGNKLPRRHQLWPLRCCCCC